MKLVIQIPCYNEEETLPVTLNDLPKAVAGFDEVEWLIIDDGSRDRTVEVAKQHGVDHILSVPENRGLANAFMVGLERCLRLGADVIVNTDADNQYSASNIPDLVQPILANQADIVIGARPIMDTEHFSFLKKVLQRLGSWVVRKTSGTSVEDAPSGFRAISKDAALKLNVFNKYTYTLETIIQSGSKNIRIQNVNVCTNAELRPSRLFKSITSYIKKSMTVIIRAYIIYRPFRTFISLALISFAVAMAISLRFLWFYWNGEGSGHIQSLILASILFGAALQFGVIAFVADLLAVNRRLIEDVQYRLKSIQYETHDGLIPLPNLDKPKKLRES
jgi:glycosyltransferase involved in cell wall biosynthesis